MRSPSSIRAERELRATDADMKAEGLRVPTRRPIPPNDWDDLVVSYRRGQEWARDGYSGG